MSRTPKQKWELIMYRIHPDVEERVEIGTFKRQIDAKRKERSIRKHRKYLRGLGIKIPRIRFVIKPRYPRKE